MGKALRLSQSRNMEALEKKSTRKPKRTREAKQGEKQIKTLALTQRFMLYHLRPMLALKGRELTLELSRVPLTWKRKQILKH